MQGINNISGIVSTGDIKKTQLQGKQLQQFEKSEFLKKFEKIKSDDVRDKIESLYEKIVEKSESLKNNLYLKDVLEYKKLVKELLSVAVENSHSFAQQNLLDRRGRHRMYSIVKQVDRELDIITKEFLKDQLDHVNILKRIDGVKGLLLDIIM